MAELKVGTAVDRRRLSSVLEIFRLIPESGSRFPDYVAGQYIALRRDRCRLTKRIVGPEDVVRYVPDLDESGRLTLGPVTHSYSIASAPFESREHEQRLVKTGGRLVKHARYYWLLLAESHLTRRLFGAMLRRIWALPVPTG